MAGILDFISSLYLDIDPQQDCYQDSGGSTLAGVGDPVGYLADQAGGDPVIQANTSSKPVLAVDGLGWRNLQFDGVDDWVGNGTFEPNVDGSQPWEITTLVSWTNVGTVLLSDAAHGRYQLGSTSTQFVFGGFYYGDFSTTPRRWMQMLQGPTSQLLINGASVAAAGPGGPNSWSAGLNIGRRGTGDAYSDVTLWRMLIHEELSPTNRSGLYSYLSTLYASSPPSSGIPPAFIHHHFQTMGAR